MKMNTRLTAAIVLALSLAACKKEDREDPTGNACRLSKVYAYDLSSGTVEDSVLYTYTGDKVSKVRIGSQFAFILTYEGNKIVRRDYQDDNGTPYAVYDLITYNNDGTLKTIQTYDASTGRAVKDWRTEFTYTAGKLTGLTVYTGDNEVFEDYTYVYQGNNISKTEYRSWNSPEPESVHLFRYDQQKNVFASNPQALLLNGYIMYEMGDFVPFVLSGNNINGIKEEGEAQYVAVETISDAQQNVTAIKMGGLMYEQFFYQCP